MGCAQRIILVSIRKLAWKANCCGGYGEPPYLFDLIDDYEAGTEARSTRIRNTIHTFMISSSNTVA